MKTEEEGTGKGRGPRVLFLRELHVLALLTPVQAFSISALRSAAALGWRAGSWVAEQLATLERGFGALRRTWAQLKGAWSLPSLPHPSPACDSAPWDAVCLTPLLHPTHTENAYVMSGGKSRI